MNAAETLEGKIREKARKSLEDKLTEAFRKPKDYIYRHGANTQVELETTEGVRSFSCVTVLDSVKQTLLEELAPAEEEFAIEAFMSKVEHLQDQIDELKESAS